MSWMTVCDGAVTSKRACSAFFITREPSPFPAAPTSTLHSGSQLTDRAGIINNKISAAMSAFSCPCLFTCFKPLTHEIKCYIIIGLCIKCTRCPAVAMLAGNVIAWASNCGCLKPSPACNADMIPPPVNKNCCLTTTLLAEHLLYIEQACN